MNTNKGGDILEALEQRLKLIKQSAGYDNTIKHVRLNDSEPTLNTAEQDLPLIEIFDEGDDYEHGSGSSLWAFVTITLYIVAPKAYTDKQMQSILADVRRNLFGGTSDATGNLGITLGGKIAGMELINSKSDMNMIASNRVYLLRFRMRDHRTTYRD